MSIIDEHRRYAISALGCTYSWSYCSLVYFFWWLDGSTGRSDNNAISAFNKVEVEVEAEIGKKKRKKKSKRKEWWKKGSTKIVANQQLKQRLTANRHSCQPYYLTVLQCVEWMHSDLTSISYCQHSLTCWPPPHLSCLPFSSWSFYKLWSGHCSEAGKADLQYKFC